MDKHDTKLKFMLLSSLSKVFADQAPIEQPREESSMLLNEAFAFQAAFYWGGVSTLRNLAVVIDSDLAPYASRYKVELAPSELPCYSDHDEDVLRCVPGLYPDILEPMDDGGLTLPPMHWRSVWIEIAPDGMAPAGSYPVTVILKSAGGEELGRKTLMLEVLDASLPGQELLYTNWFHADCIATRYGVKVFSGKHWDLMRQYIRAAARHGVNMILTPVFTPPLDTAPGGERPTVQLVDVEKDGDRYSFGFVNLKKWITLCRDCGIQAFEVSHLFTQWGARHAPKIMVRENGELKKLFGWDTDAAGDAYRDFLSQFLPALTNFFNLAGLKDRVYFHVSDEPGLNDLDCYQKASALVQKHTAGYHLIDALSDFAFYEKKLVRTPVVATSHIDRFLAEGVPELWCYYCCGQYIGVSNRFFCMPSARTRVIGLQMYKYNIKGFLQWGYNFWNAMHSTKPVDPFRTTDAGCAFPSGDAFVVYPGDDGPLLSLRLKVFYEALQDLRALKALDERIGRPAVMDLLEEGLSSPITFSCYPHDADWLLGVREKVNRRLAAD